VGLFERGVSSRVNWLGLTENGDFGNHWL